jgi:VWFA-related protein
MRGSTIRLVGCLCLGVLLLLVVGVAAAQESIRVIVNDVVAEPIPNEAAYHVTAYVTVVGSDHQPLSGLTVNAFTASQDGSQVQIDSAAVTERPASIVLAIDTSGSMAYQGKMDAVKAAAIGFVDQLAADDRVAVVYFSDTIVIGQQDLTGDFVLIKNVIGLLQAEPYAGTCLYDAAYSAIELASKAPVGSRAVVLLTDGIDETADQSGPCSKHTVDDVEALAQDSATRTPIYTIGVGTRVNAAELDGVAEKTGGASLLSPDAAGVSLLFDTVGAQIKNQYALVYRAETTSGEHNLTVTVTAGGVAGIGTRKFLAPELPPVLSLSGLEDEAILTGSQKVRAVISGKTQATGVTFSLDGKALAEAKEEPFELVLDASRISAGRHELVAVANLADGSQLNQAIAFEVQPAQPASLAEIETSETSVVSAWPGWALPAGIGAVLILAGLVGFLLVRRKPRTQIIGGAAVASGRTGGAADLTMDMVGGEKFATLTVQESLTLRKGQAFDLSSEVVTIGRGADSSVIVPDSPVSRNHAEIRRLGSEFYVFDLGSTYGTFVNDTRAGTEGLPIHDGDRLRLGTRTVMMFTVVLPQAAGPEDKTVDMGAGTPDSAEATVPGWSSGRAADGTVPADRPGVDEGGTIPIDMGGVGDRGETIPADIIIPREARSDTEQAAPPMAEDDTEQSRTTNDDTIRSDPGEEDATLRSSD